MKTYYHCGEDTGKPTIANQYPLCDIGLSKGWKNKPFTVIAKVGRGKRAKTGNTSQEDVQENLKDDAAEIDNNEGKEDDAFDENADDHKDFNETEEVEHDEDELPLMYVCNKSIELDYSFVIPCPRMTLSGSNYTVPVIHGDLIG